jgi:hypothetical protein
VFSDDVSSIGEMALVVTVTVSSSPSFFSKQQQQQHVRIPSRASRQVLMATMMRRGLLSAKNGMRPSLVRWPMTRRVHSGRQIAGSFGQKDSVVISFKDSVVL